MKAWFTAMFATLLFSANASALSFSLEGVVDGSSTYSVTTGGVTMTVDALSSGLLRNFADGPDNDGLDFGQFVGVGIETTEFSLGFDANMLVTDWIGFTVLDYPIFSVIGPGVASTGNQGSGGAEAFSEAPLLFLAHEAYTFSIPSPSDASIMLFRSIEASLAPAAPVPVPGSFGLLCFGLLLTLYARRLRRAAC